MLRVFSRNKMTKIQKKLPHLVLMRFPKQNKIHRQYGR